MIVVFQEIWDGLKILLEMNSKTIDNSLWPVISSGFEEFAIV